ncbi:hypothetical protein EI555_010858 [Monodon monoceros]|uniref:UTP--glucose-1-phosphate uridylyltransferase n=1 Tax=Monodon monoceros TaxID=40151 RepID=A0A4U1FLF2_MONMO|nr:hypothetical protein EI555_010858 [Monodon monoceros]
MSSKSIPTVEVVERERFQRRKSSMEGEDGSRLPPYLGQKEGGVKSLSLRKAAIFRYRSKNENQIGTRKGCVINSSSHKESGKSISLASLQGTWHQLVLPREDQASEPQQGFGGKGMKTYRSPTACQCHSRRFPGMRLVLTTTLRNRASDCPESNSFTDLESQYFMISEALLTLCRDSRLHDSNETGLLLLRWERSSESWTLTGVGIQQRKNRPSFKSWLPRAIQRLCNTHNVQKKMNSRALELPDNVAHEITHELQAREFAVTEGKRGEGKGYIFESNIDNLGTTVDLYILNHLTNPPNGKPCQFVMEVTNKTHADVKGETLTQYEGKLRLMEIAQVPKAYADECKSVSKFKIFNTNNLWISLTAVKRLQEQNAIDMEIIVNPKTLDGGLNVIQLETAVGAAIKSFENSLGINVPRSRFLPVNTTSDLLLVMSNLYSLNAGSLTMSEKREFPTLPLVKLGGPFTKVQDYLRRFESVPDMLELDHLTVSGDKTFDKNISLQGTVIIVANHGD